MPRPPFGDIRTGKEFNRWYWLKAELVAICREAGLPAHGRKFDLRDRIMYALDHEGARLPEPAPSHQDSHFDWAKSNLTPETLITDSVTFGPNFRRFMQGQVAGRFRCSAAFMDWVKANTGRTLKDAVAAYEAQERKHQTTPRPIAAGNMYNQYTRDILADNPQLGPDDARNYWLRKKTMPTEDGFVRYARTDLDLP